MQDIEQQQLSHMARGKEEEVAAELELLRGEVEKERHALSQVLPWSEHPCHYSACRTPLQLVGRGG